jgi:hypothetical protein
MTGVLLSALTVLVLLVLFVLAMPWMDWLVERGVFLFGWLERYYEWVERRLGKR